MVRQHVPGDTVGFGGVLRTMRTAPELVAIGQDMERRCPGATLINYVNPMSMLVRVPLRGPGGVIGQVEAYYERPFRVTRLRRTELGLHAEHAAMNVLNVRLFGLVERAKKEWEATFDAIRTDTFGAFSRDI